MKKRIKIAKSSGFCFGIKRTIELAEKVVIKNKNKIEIKSGCLLLLQIFLYGIEKL